MKHDRLHAYEVLSRVAKVREVRASVVLAEASAEVLACQEQHDVLGVARDAVSMASQASMKSTAGLDLARYEMLSSLDTWLAQKEQVAAGELTLAEEARVERANASVLATRYREQICDKVTETSGALQQERFAAQQEDAMECWLRGEVK